MVVTAVGVVIAVVAVIVVAGPVVVVVVVLVVAVVVHGIGRVEVVLLGLVFLAAFCLDSVVALGVKNTVNTNVLNGSDRKPKTTVFMMFFASNSKKYGIYSGF